MNVLEASPAKKLLLVGNPNVGKSVIFGRLTGRYAVVSNYPGTTVEVSRGELRLAGFDYEVIDSPGVNSLVPQSEDERVTCDLLLRERPDLIIQVADAKNLRRSLLLTSQLVEFRRPMILVLNMLDEAQDRGLAIDREGIAALFGIPVVETIATYGHGMRQLIQAMQSPKVPSNPLHQGPWLRTSPTPLNGEEAVCEDLAMEWMELNDAPLMNSLEQGVGVGTVACLRASYRDFRQQHRSSPAREVAEARRRLLASVIDRLRTKVDTRARDDESPAARRLAYPLLWAGVALFVWNEVGGLFGLGTPYGKALQWLEANRGDPLSGRPGVHSLLNSLLFGASAGGAGSFGLMPALVHFLLVLAPVVIPVGLLLARDRGFAARLGVWTRRPGTGIPILCCVLLLFYEFVGYTGAQTLVGLLEQVVFGTYLIPALQSLLPQGFLFDLLLGEFGAVSMGLTYAVAIVLPVVTTFFLGFGLLEDSGYLPRLSVLSDKIMRSMGLNGKAVLPMVLGLGCCTMATITTRILNSKKERLIATLLLALGIPCSAQLGVILGVSSSFSFRSTLVVLAVIALQLLLVGHLASRLIPGRSSAFVLEIPPIRVPRLRNLFLKTGHRIRWYISEAVPLFIYGTLFLFLMDRFRIAGRSLLDWTEIGLSPVLAGMLQLPREIAPVFVLGFLRRDYGAAGLFDMARQGVLTGTQAIVSLVVITLFVPCVASFLVIVKEQGLRRAVMIVTFIVPFALAVGGLLGWAIRALHLNLG